jgi:SAM-dependent methyltransferase
MALISYDSVDAAAFEADRHLSADALGGWRDAIGRHVDPRPGARILDLGCGTGSWARAFRTWWPGVDLLAVEPSPAMRDRAVFQPIVPGTADDVPFADASLDGVWLSTVIHHVPDLAAAAGEIRRVLKPGAPVMIRSVFRGRHHAISLFRWFPEAVAVLDRYPSVSEVEAAFATTGLATVGCEPVPQVTAPSLAHAAADPARTSRRPPRPAGAALTGTACWCCAERCRRLLPVLPDWAGAATNGNRLPADGGGGVQLRGDVCRYRRDCAGY